MSEEHDPKGLDQQRWEQIRREAFAEDRFLIVLRGCHIRPMVVFVPKYDEAPFFLKKFVAPFLLQVRGTFDRESWVAPLPSEMEAAGEQRPVFWRQYLRWMDVETCEIWTETADQRQQLDALIPEAVREFR